MKTLKIGKIELKNPLVLAPMVDITNLPYRLVCRKAGAALAYTEMINVPAMIHTNPKTLQMMQTSKDDSPLGIQITGNNPHELEKVLPILKKYDLVDINAGCPSERITENESGSCLLNSPKKIVEMIKILRKNNITTTVKIRLGFKKNNVLEIAKMIEKAGADALTLHPRLATQGYDVPAQWEWIKKVKPSVKIPVIGCGDVLSPEQALEMLETTGCDGVMIARGAIGDPLIFKRALEYLKTGKKTEFSFKDNIAAFQDYLKLSKRCKFEDLAIIKHLGSKFIKGIPGAAKKRNELMQFKSLKEIEDFFREIKAKP
ncbi:MAG: tRNA-dihydrouridine synthase family protein [archaeon]|jgi:tRNA-dihydrouridine synthase B|nr:tRNA-dihydrouridine synthase family protein [archaeon]